MRAGPWRRVVTTDAVSLFLALLAVLAESAVVGAVVLSVGGRLSPQLARARPAAATAVPPQALGLALAVAAVATAGSLYFSEVAHFTPCRLCWYQRFCMYPLVPLLAWGTWRQDRRVCSRPAGVTKIRRRSPAPTTARRGRRSSPPRRPVPW